MIRASVILGVTIVVLSSLSCAYAAPAKSVAAPSSRESAGNEVVVLQAQLEVMRQYDQRLLNTVYWSLGVLATLAVFLVGFGWFANFRLYERDKTALRQELRTFIQEEFSRIQGVLQVDADKRYEAVSKSVGALVSEASDAIRRDRGSFGAFSVLGVKGAR